MTVGIDLPWTKMINPELMDLSAGTLSLKQSPQPLHLNHNGDMHAGVLFSMSEMAGMGVVVLLLGDLANTSLVVVKNVSIDFTARAHGPITFTAAVSPEQQKALLAKAEAGEKIEEPVWVEAHDEHGKRVCSSTVTAVISPRAG